jgi:hypothetical protein
VSATIARRLSPHGDLIRWKLTPAIVKTGSTSDRAEAAG